LGRERVDITRGRLTAAPMEEGRRAGTRHSIAVPTGTMAAPHEHPHPMNELERTLMTIGCRDTDVIPKVPGAGSIVREGEHLVQVMHNGVRVQAGGYYGDWMAQIIRGLQGHHEPQEELVFHHLLRYVRHRTRMVELGAFWSYYTLWFLKEIPGSTALCVEPDAHNLAVGRNNAWLNGMLDRVEYRNAWVGGDAAASMAGATENSGGEIQLPVMNMESVVDACGGQPLELVHMDVQGAELAFVRSMRAAVDRRLLRFVMVSTHHSSISGSTTTHPDCVEALRTLGANILVEHDVIESYSGDGMILASFYQEDAALKFPELSRNRAQTSLFKSA
jgi:FkbM family methyltransferase